MPLTWVIGASGLVGQAVCRAGVEAGHDVRRVPVPWQADRGAQRAALRAGLQMMFEEAPGDPWGAVWVAGAGVVGTSPAALQVEADVFAAFLEDLADRSLSGLGPSGLFFASSAGGLYAGSANPPFTERSPVAPLAPYGHQKLAMESLVNDFAARTGVPAMIGRITNVYGPGQNLAKAQGLVSQLGKAYLLRRPISLYVSLDTIRDYIFVDDCAKMIITGLGELTALDGTGVPVTKIIGSGVPVTIATVLGEYRRLFRRRPPVVLGDSPNRRFQVRDLRMRSVTWRHLDRFAATTLPTGIGATVADLAARLRTGELSTATR